MPALFEPLHLRTVTLPNRIVLAPMCQYSALDGVPNEWHTIHYGRYAAAGLGLMITEATHVSAKSRITPGCTGLWNDAQEEAFARIVQDVKRFGGGPIGIQIGHAGRKGSSAVPWEGGKSLEDAPAWVTEAPSAIPHDNGWIVPEALDASGLKRVKAEFVASAKRAVMAGFDLIELHAAHGYLLHQFLSPVANQRTDAYGGDTARRLRFPVEVFEAVRAAVPAHVPVGVRVSATDWIGPEGWDVPDTIEFLQALKASGCDFVDVSSGGVSPRQKVQATAGYQVPFAAAIKKAVGLPTIAVGMITDPHHAERILSEGAADMIALARGLLNDPFWAWRAADALGGEVSVPVQYLRGRHVGVDTPREIRPAKA